MQRFFLTLATILLTLCLAPPHAHAQIVDQTISLADPATPVAEDPFGLAVDPDGVHVYVALAGDFDSTFPSTPTSAALSNNSRIAKVNTMTGTVVATGSTGLFPEDIALTFDSFGQTRHVFVTNSTDGTVTILDPSLGPVVTVTLTPCFGGNFGAVFPFGILASPDSARVYVGTLASCGTVDVIDSDPLSATFSQIVDSFTVSNMSGRMAWTTYPQLVIAATDFGTLSAGVTVVDVTSPATAVYRPGISGPGTFGFGPGASDIAVRPNGNVLIPVSFLAAPHLIEMNPQTGLLVADMNLSAFITSSSLHGLGLSEDGERAVVTCLGAQGEVAFIHVPTQTVFNTVQHGGSQPNEVVFSPDQSRVIITLQQAEQVVSYRALPGFDLDAHIQPISLLGQMATLEIDDIEMGQQVVIYASLVGGGPIPLGGVVLYLSQPIFFLTMLTADAGGDASFSMLLPVDPMLIGAAPHFQAATIDGDGTLRLSNGTQTLFQ